MTLLGTVALCLDVSIFQAEFQGKCRESCLPTYDFGNASSLLSEEGGGAVDGSIGAVHVEGPKRAVDGSRRDAEGTRGAVEGSKLLKEL